MKVLLRSKSEEMDKKQERLKPVPRGRRQYDALLVFYTGRKISAVMI
jgi:hypothetical protein